MEMNKSKKKKNRTNVNTNGNEDRVVRNILKRLTIIKSCIVHCLEEIRNGILYVLGVDTKSFSFSCCGTQTKDIDNITSKSDDGQPFTEQSFDEEVNLLKHSQHSPCYSVSSPQFKIFERDVQPIHTGLAAPIMVIDNRDGNSNVLIEQRDRVSQIQTKADIHSEEGNNKTMKELRTSNAKYNFTCGGRENLNYIDDFTQISNSAPPSINNITHVQICHRNETDATSQICYALNNTIKSEGTETLRSEHVHTMSVGSGDNNFQNWPICTKPNAERSGRKIWPRKNTPKRTRHKSSDTIKVESSSIQSMDNADDSHGMLDISTDPDIYNYSFVEAVDEQIRQEKEARRVSIALKNAFGPKIITQSVPPTRNTQSTENIQDNGTPNVKRTDANDTTAALPKSKDVNDSTGARSKFQNTTDSTATRPKSTDANDTAASRLKTGRKIKYPHGYNDRKDVNRADRIIAHPGYQHNGRKIPMDIGTEETTYPRPNKSLAVSKQEKNTDKSLIKSSLPKEALHNGVGISSNFENHIENECQPNNTDILQNDHSRPTEIINGQIQVKVANNVTHIIPNEDSVKNLKFLNIPDAPFELDIETETSRYSRSMLKEPPKKEIDPRQKRRILNNVQNVFDGYNKYTKMQGTCVPSRQDLYGWLMILTNCLLNAAFMSTGSEDEQLIYDEVMRLYTEVNNRLNKDATKAPGVMPIINSGRVAPESNLAEPKQPKAVNENDVPLEIIDEQRNYKGGEQPEAEEHDANASIGCGASSESCIVTSTTISTARTRPIIAPARFNPVLNATPISSLSNQPMSSSHVDQLPQVHNTVTGTADCLTGMPHTATNQPKAAPLRSWKANRAPGAKSKCSENKSSENAESVNESRIPKENVRRKLIPARKLPTSETGHCLQATPSNLNNMETIPSGCAMKINMKETGENLTNTQGTVQQRTCTDAQQKDKPERMVNASHVDNEMVPNSCFPANGICQDGKTDRSNIEHLSAEVFNFVYENKNRIFNFIHFPKADQLKLSNYQQERQRLCDLINLYIKQTNEGRSSRHTAGRSSELTKCIATVLEANTAELMSKMQEGTPKKQTTIEQTSPATCEFLPSPHQTTLNHQYLETEDMAQDLHMALTSTPKKQQRCNGATPGYNTDCYEEEGTNVTSSEIDQYLNRLKELLNDDLDITDDSEFDTSVTVADTTFDMSEFLNFTSYLETNDTLDYNCLTVKPGHGDRPNKKKLANAFREKKKTKGQPNKHLEQTKLKPIYEFEYTECEEDEETVGDTNDGAGELETMETKPDTTGGGDDKAPENEVVHVLDDREFNMVPEEVIHKDDNSKLKDIEGMYSVVACDNKKEKNKKKKKCKEPKKILNIDFQFIDKPYRRY